MPRPRLLAGHHNQPAQLPLHARLLTAASCLRPPAWPGRSAQADCSDPPSSVCRGVSTAPTSGCRCCGYTSCAAQRNVRPDLSWWKGLVTTAKLSHLAAHAQPLHGSMRSQAAAASPAPCSHLQAVQRIGPGGRGALLQQPPVHGTPCPCTGHGCLQAQPRALHLWLALVVVVSEAASSSMTAASDRFLTPPPGTQLRGPGLPCAMHGVSRGPSPPGCPPENTKCAAAPVSNRRTPVLTRSASVGVGVPSRCSAYPSTTPARTVVPGGR